MATNKKPVLKTTVALRAAALREQAEVFTWHQVKVEPGHAIAKGVFHSLPSSMSKDTERSRPWKAVCTWNGITITFQGWVLLDDNELTLLHSLIGLANITDWAIGHTPQSQLDTAMRGQLQLNLYNNHPIPSNLVVEVTASQLALMLYKSKSSSDIRRVRDSLKRLQGTIMTVEKDSQNWFSSQLIGGAMEVMGKMAISLNPLASQAILANTQWVQADLANMLALNNPTAKVLYHHLCAKVWAGQTRSFKLDDLTAFAYSTNEQALLEAMAGDDPEALKKAKQDWRNRRHQTKAALAVVAEIEGWDIKHTATMVHIKRT